jgi:uncharacterized protein
MNKIASILVIITLFFASCSSPSVVKTSEYKRLRLFLDTIKVIDCHEHYYNNEETFLKKKVDFFFFSTWYTYSDILTMGNLFPKNEKWRDTSLSVEKRWELFKPIYDRLKNTAYWLQNVKGFEKMYGIKFTGEIDQIYRINECIKKTYKPGIYEKILNRDNHIETLLVYDYSWQGGKKGISWSKRNYPAFMKPVRYIDWLVRYENFANADSIKRLCSNWNIDVKNLKDIKKLCEVFIEESQKESIAGYKLGVAYSRTLDFTNYSEEKCEAIVKNLLNNKVLDVNEKLELSSCILNYIFEEINKYKMPLSIHTGLQTGGSKDIRMSDPQLLIPMFGKYPDIRFDIFHGGWPYTEQWLEIGKSWPNVFLNFTWLPVITPVECERVLSEALELIPVNKLFMYGGDSGWPEYSIGHLEVAKDIAARVLAQKVIAGRFTEDEAKEYAKRIFYNNPKEFYGFK